MKTIKIGVFIGRFQSLHLGHQEIIEKAKKDFDELIVIIGSDNTTVSLRNPFSTEIRIKMLESAGVKPHNILAIRDSYYDFEWWKKEIYNLVNKRIKDVEIYLIGHYKESDSFWLDAFPNWKLFDVGKLENDINATDIRNNLFKYNNFFSDNISEDVYKIISQWRNDNNDIFLDLRDEFAFVEQYKEQWENTPYPVIFTTVDALLRCNEHILLIKRGKRPGKGLYALPGGFIEPNEILLNGALRELYEETNVELKEDYLKSMLKQIKVFDEPKRDERGRFITHCHYFDCKWSVDGLSKIKAGDDASEAMWFPIEKLNEISNQFYADHYKIIMNMLEK